MEKELEGEREEAGPAWEERVLCSDESCIGVIGPDGRCKECGRPYGGPLPVPSLRETQPADEYETSDDAQTDDDDGITDEGLESEADDDAWQTRKLCRDEACIGVIGPDGRCKECGRPYDE